MESKKTSTDKINNDAIIVNPLQPNIYQQSWYSKHRRLIKLFYICITAVILLIFVLFQIYAPRDVDQTNKIDIPAPVVPKLNEDNDNNNNSNNNQGFNSIHAVSMERIRKFIENLQDPNDVRLLSKYINHRELSADETRRLDTLRKELNLYDIDEPTAIPVMYRRR